MLQLALYLANVAHLVRASGCGSEGSGFNPHHSPQDIIKDFFGSLFVLLFAHLAPILSRMQNIRDTVIDALRQAYIVHQSLGADGEELVHKNQFGDTALCVDIECEQAILKTLKDSDLPIKVISEEHGTTLFQASQKYLGILDGLDGSSVYRKARGKKRYGTMFAIFDTTNPRYDDYLVCGIMQHATDRMFIAEKGKGAYIIKDGKEHHIQVSSAHQLDARTRIYIDESFEYNRTTFSQHLIEFHPKYEGASSLYYADLAEGTAEVVLECTRKGNLEIAVEYGITTEAGGVVTDLSGQSIGNQEYLSFGQNSQLGVISAANRSLALELIKRIES
jgi:fructose-1,6-bisphosphatase/inositol monophosphatase family enzyme